jgi:hypothetical protein
VRQWEQCKQPNQFVQKQNGIIIEQTVDVVDDGVVVAVVDAATTDVGRLGGTTDDDAL